MFIDNVKHGSGLQSSNANPSPSSPRHRSYHDDIPSFDLFKEEDPEFNFMYGDDNVGNKTEKRVRQPTTMAPILGSTFLPYSHLLISILLLSLFSYTCSLMFLFLIIFGRCCQQDGCWWQQNELGFI
jgi:hypothetical protein